MSLILRNKPFWKFYIGSKPVVLLHKPESAEVLLSNAVQVDKAFEYTFLLPWLKEGLITSSGAKWKSRRRMITPSFHFRILEDFLPVFNEQSMVLVNKLTMTRGTEVDIVPLMSLCALDIICETAMGQQVGAQYNSESIYVKSLKKTQGSVIRRIFRPWLWPDFIFYSTSEGRDLRKSLKCMSQFTTKVIAERRAEFIQLLEEGKLPTNPEEEFITTRRRAFLDLLLYHHLVEGTLGLEDVEEEVEAFMFTGHDSASLSISWVLYLLGLHPDIQKRVAYEIQDIFGDDHESPVTMEDVKRMKYIECVMKESQRLYPVVPYIGRKLTEDLPMEKYTIPAGATVAVFLYMIHHNPDVYPNPEAFDPDRFLPENVNIRHPFAYLPFSAGPRNCVGQKFALIEQKVLLANILRRFRVTSLIQRDQLELVPEMVLTPKPGLLVRFDSILPEINNNLVPLE